MQRVNWRNWLELMRTADWTWRPSRPCFGTPVASWLLGVQPTNLIPVEVASVEVIAGPDNLFFDTKIDCVEKSSTCFRSAANSTNVFIYCIYLFSRCRLVKQRGWVWQVFNYSRFLFMGDKSSRRRWINHGGAPESHHEQNRNLSSIPVIVYVFLSYLRSCENNPNSDLARVHRLQN